MIPHVVLDTNVLVAGTRSRRGASFRLLALVGTGKFDISFSVALVLEYEDALARHSPRLTATELADLLDFICQAARRQTVFYLWRPTLRDPKDDHVLEVAVAGACDGIVTFNRRDFAGAERFGLRIMSPQALLSEIGEPR